MNRRSLLAGAVFVPWLPTKIELPIRKLRSEFVVEEIVHVQLLLEAHRSAESAETWRQSWMGRAFETEGEWYLMESEERELPEDLANMPGDLQYHSYVWGEAAEEDALMVGAFRHEHIGCVIRISGNHEAEMIALAEFFASRNIPEVWELAWSNSQLQGFIPTSETLGMPVEQEPDGFWP